MTAKQPVGVVPAPVIRARPLARASTLREYPRVSKGMATARIQRVVYERWSEAEALGVHKPPKRSGDAGQVRVEIGRDRYPVEGPLVLPRISIRLNKLVPVLVYQLQAGALRIVSHLFDSVELILISTLSATAVWPSFCVSELTPDSSML